MADDLVSEIEDCFFLEKIMEGDEVKKFRCRLKYEAQDLRIGTGCIGISFDPKPIGTSNYERNFSKSSTVECPIYIPKSDMLSDDKEILKEKMRLVSEFQRAYLNTLLGLKQLSE